MSIVKASSAVVEIEQSKAVQVIQGKLIVAKNFRRNQKDVFDQIMAACERPSLARIAHYALPRGKQTITGPSIRLAEAIAQLYENIEYGARTLESGDKQTTCEAFCFDMEKNFSKVDTFIVRHERKANGAVRAVTDPTELSELIESAKARRMRNCILGVVPRDIVDAASERCREVLAEGTKVELSPRIQRILDAFKRHGVSKELIDTRLGYDAAEMSGDDIADLQAIFNSVKEGARVDDYFGDNQPEPTQVSPEQERSELNALSAKLHGVRR